MLNHWTTLFTTTFEMCIAVNGAQNSDMTKMFRPTLSFELSCTWRSIVHVRSSQAILATVASERGKTVGDRERARASPTPSLCARASRGATHGAFLLFAKMKALPKSISMALMAPRGPRVASVTRVYTEAESGPVDPRPASSERKGRIRL